MNKIFFLVLIAISATAFDWHPTKTVSGVVTSKSDGQPLPGINIVVKGTSLGVVTDASGRYQIEVPDEKAVLVFSFIGFVSREIKVGKNSVINVALEEDVTELSEVVVSGYSGKRRSEKDAAAIKSEATPHYIHPPAVGYAPEQNTEEYATFTENIFRDPVSHPLSTFSIDVDRASYTNIRRFINNGQRPPADAVRIEELVNYFDYNYPQPTDGHPCAISTELSQSPWNAKHKLLQIGVQAREVPLNNLPPSNLVFLIDVSGSMAQPNKLPLVKESFAMLVNQLRDEDRVAIVVYAGAAGTVLEPTAGSEKKKIIAALDRLQAGGSTAGGEGLRLAYALAEENFRTNGNNRVIIATDGDFNVGESSNDAMEKLIVGKRKAGIFLTVLGYGMGNYKDSKLELLADKGNGNYAYIDNITEARKTLVTEFGGTLFTLAKDVKIQVEFNPANVQAYRLIGYENRLLNSEDFNNDRKDAGEMGSGHTVTALYEIIPAGVKSDYYDVDPSKYQRAKPSTDAKYSDELLTIKLRYKKPDGDTSSLLTKEVKNSAKALAATSDDFRWAASVAAFGMLLRESDQIRDFSFDEVVQMAQGARGTDEDGFRAEFVNMVKSFGLISRR